jgi:polysaccharide pyruvyl transferase WcaK-like protein
VRLVAPFGFYGWGNTGDEGTLCGFARLLQLTGLEVSASVGSRNPEHTARAEPAFRYFAASGLDPRRWWAKLRGEAQAVIGGTPISDVLGTWPLCDLVPLVRTAGRRGQPFVFVGSGIEELRRPDSVEVFRNELSERITRWSVRGPESRERLLRYGVPPDRVTVAADLAWLIDPMDPGAAEARLQRLGLANARPLVAVSVCNERLCFDSHPGMTDALAATLDALIEEFDARVLFLCAEIRSDDEFDFAAAEKLRGRMKENHRAFILPPEYLSPHQIMAIIGCCGLVISMRYHVCLFSATQGIPFVAIERSDKVSDLCADLDWHMRVGLPFDADSGLLEHCRRLLVDARSALAQLEAGRLALRARALLNREPIEALMH